MNRGAIAYTQQNAGNERHTELGGFKRRNGQQLLCSEYVSPDLFAERDMGRVLRTSCVDPPPGLRAVMADR